MRKLLYLTFALTQLLRAGADPRELSLRWTELDSAVAGEQVRILLPSGARIEGKVAAVEVEGLRARITKTSDRRLEAKGEVVLPRASVSVLQVVTHGVGWRILGTAIGPILVGAAGASVAARGAGTVNDLPKYVGFGAAAVVGTGIGGYYLGKRAGRKITTIRIVR
jgi:hypothetical protein